VILLHSAKAVAIQGDVGSRDFGEQRPVLGWLPPRENTSAGCASLNNESSGPDPHAFSLPWTSIALAA
jgi:hypothetical protein